MNNLDQNNYEEAAEREAMMKTMHQPMKKWFFKQSSGFASKFGAFPIFWQDFKTWEHFKEVKRHFLKAQENPDYKPTGDEVEAKQPEAAPIPDPVPAETPAATTETPAATEPTPEVNDKGLTPAEEAKKARKRKTRWGASSEETKAATPEAEDAAATGADGKKKKRKSRWSTDTAPVGPGAVTVFGAGAAGPLGGGMTLTPQAQQMLVLRMKLQEIEQKILTVVLDAKQQETDPNRPASPPPVYDAMGKRVNTREVVLREQYQKNRLGIIEEMVKVNPAFKPPADYIKSKLNRKIMIPDQKLHPDVNFIGLIIGPRGNTQKKMERDTGCKIAIRGKGSVKDGSRKMKNPPEPDANDALHVLIQGEREEDVERAAQMINELIDVDNKEKVEEHKASQLRQLAIINGTLREEDFCHNCGERGHKSWECPKRVDTFAQANVKCEICGDSSHITSDCPLRAKPSEAQQKHLDSEYLSFLEELGEGPATGAKPKPAAPAPAAPAPAPTGGLGGPPSQPGTNGIPTDFRPIDRNNPHGAGLSTPLSIFALAQTASPFPPTFFLRL
jgi:splicing factor 1